MEPIWKPTTEKPDMGRRRRNITIIVYKYGEPYHVTYDAKTGKIANRHYDIVGNLTDFEWWCLAPRCKLNLS